MTPDAIAREAYRLWRDRRIAPDDTLRAVLDADGCGEYTTDPEARRRYRELADAYLEYARPQMVRDGLACPYCGQMLRAGARWCSATCERYDNKRRSRGAAARAA